MNAPQPTIRLIGVAGSSASGKTTLCRYLKESAQGDQICSLELDSYYRCNAHLTPAERGALNFDHPNSFELPLLLEHLRALRAGTPIQVPQYDFSVHTRRPETRELAPKLLVVFEGILALHWPEVRELLDLKVYVDAPAELCLQRRIERDVRERGRTEESVLSQWRGTAFPMFQSFIEPCRAAADLVIPGSDFDRSVTEVILRDPRLGLDR